MQFGVVGINHKLAPLKLRETCAKVCGRKFRAGSHISPDHSFILLSTCNRTEIYFSSEDLAETHAQILRSLRSEIDEEFEQRLYSFFGADCLFHLSAVACGLDSAIPFETEIQGQVKAAYLEAAAFSLLPGELHFLFQKALKNGKRVRSSLSLKRGLPALEEAIFEILRSHVPSLGKTSLLVVGASSINLKILRLLQAKGVEKITLTNRTGSKARALADRLGVRMLPWERLSECSLYDVLLFGTKSPDCLLNSLPEGCAQKLIFDLSVPRNVSPELAKGHRLVDIDLLNCGITLRRKEAKRLLSLSKNLITESIERQMARYSERAPFVSSLL